MKSTALEVRVPKKNFAQGPPPIGKLPPQAPDLEEAILGAVMLERNALNAIIEFLRPEHFYVPQHQEIYSAVLDLFKSSEPVDIRTVNNQLRKSGRLEFIGGTVRLAELTSKISSAANIEYYARVVVEQSIKRQIIQTTSELQQEAYEETTDVFALLDKTEQTIFRVSDGNLRKNYDSIKNLMYKAIQDIQKIQDNKDGITGVPCGFIAQDRITSGWQPSDLIIIAARPGMGKTSYVLAVLRNAAVDFNIPVAIFSLEMASVQLINRMIAAETEIDAERIKRGQLSSEEWTMLAAKTNRLAAAPIFIDDTPALSVLELRAKCRRLKAEHNVGLIVVDYLQLMRGDNSGNREQEISSISRALKTIAKELNVPVIALSQLSRAVETRGGDKRPQLSDLRESGAIEQDADIVMFLYRPEYYKITIDEDGMPTANQAEVIIAKHRNGSTGSVKLHFIGRVTKFTDQATPSTLI